jgi:hypothetical protein
VKILVMHPPPPDLPLLSLSHIETFPSASSVCVVALVRETKFHKYTKIRGIRILLCEFLNRSQEDKIF